MLKDVKGLLCSCCSTFYRKLRGRKLPLAPGSLRRFRCAVQQGAMGCCRAGALLWLRSIAHRAIPTSEPPIANSGRGHTALASCCWPLLMLAAIADCMLLLLTATA